MNPATEQPPPPPPQPQQQPQLLPPKHPSTSCARHPEEHFTGFCPSCLCERLAVLDQTASASSSSSSRKPPTTSSTAAAALRAIFKPQSGAGAAGSASAAPSFFSELRRTKSFSASKNTGEGYFSGAFEPQRKSCDVRGRSTLWNLFTQDDERNPFRREHNLPPPQATGTAAAIYQPATVSDAVESGRPSISVSSGVPNPVIEDDEELEEEEEEVEEIRVSNLSNLAEERAQASEIVEEREESLINSDELFELKPMKDHIDLDSHTKKRDLKEIAGSFWSAASVLSKKLQKWRQKQKLKKRGRNGGGASATLPVEKPIGRQFMETQSEIADYGFGRRSCDTDPRFSLDAGRMSLDAGRISFDDPRYSFDEPRASWDGHLIGRTFPRMPTMLSVVEDSPVVHVSRSDAHIPVEEPINEEADAEVEVESAAEVNDNENAPGGSAQTREYYNDSSSRRPRRSLDRSNSIRKTAQAVVAEIDEMKYSAPAASTATATATSNAKVTPATISDYTNHSNPCSLRDEYLVLNGPSNQGKKSRRWMWNIWGLLHRRSGGGGSNGGDYRDGAGRPNGVERSLSETYGDRNGDARSLSGFGFNPKVVRSNSSVSWRSSSVRRSNGETNGHQGRKKKEEPFVLERNRSARYSPSSLENGMFRFYLTPLRNSVGGNGGGGRWRSGGAGVGVGLGGAGVNGKGRYNQAHTIARSVLKLY